MYDYPYKRYYLLVLFFLVVYSAYGLNGKEKLTGIVYDEHDKPLSGITVTVDPDRKRALTDKNGAFTIEGLYTGTYTLRVDAIGFAIYSREVDIVPGSKNTLVIRLIHQDKSLKEVNVNGVHGNPDNFIDMTKTTMPSLVITRDEIEKMGSRRLDEVLKEQTGLAIVNDIGSGNRAVGLQMQGFDSGYTMIMIDGQPMVGRNNGNFDLSRITVSNIERIEIIKGASSCLFGSEALAGVINIVTRKNVAAAQGRAAVRYGSFNMLDATLEGETPFAGKRGSVNLSANYYRTDGFNSNPFLQEGKTAPPFNSFAFQGRGRYLLAERSTLSMNGRYNTRHSTNEMSFGVRPTKDIMDEYDLNGSVSLNNIFKDGTRLKTQYYLTRYQTAQDITDLSTNEVMPGSRFKQYLHRVEVQAARSIGDLLEMTAGAGGAYELLDHSSYTGRKDMSNTFVYAQGQLNLTNKIDLTGGARFDHHNKYGAKLNPSLGLNYKAADYLTFRAAVGTGFKTPNFQQLYLVFTNAQTGYTVIGSEEFDREIAYLISTGQITGVSVISNRVGQLKPERSVNYNAGFILKPLKNIKMDVNVFYNDVRNFINSEPVAQKENGQQVYTYFNVAKAFITGAEVGINWAATKSLSLSAGYQLLYAIDKGVVDSIKNGTGLYAEFYDVPSRSVRRSVRADYFGMSNRSRHMANLKVAYDHVHTGITGSFRINYRSKYGFMEDNRANNFLDRYDKFVSSYFLFNVALQKTLSNKHLQVQMTADNLFNYRDQLMPAQQGRAILAGLSWRFFKD
ncbi:outer membrane receptor for transport of vitamin B, putative [Pedobacter sp. BAL39]|uniref:TonB-dependent receptor n=1 Tax=Pedobacter sp. BAL39 TaxID=391596 RepID=UPI000155A102|nr:TonB-dependent receptor [Pedobacter sp. BAL39]EDM36825.1 outer membrane receptor for transport of vitamin B, putative [Pedobacter sp. BAL39]